MAAQLPGDSPQIKLINEWTQGYSEKNLDILAKPLHKDFRRFIYPRSIGEPVQNKEEWLAHFASVIGFASSLEQTIHSLIETPGKVMVHATTEAKNSLGVNTTRESIFTIYIVTDDDGSLKVKQVDEFTDSKVHLEITQALAAAKAGM